MVAYPDFATWIPRIVRLHSREIISEEEMTWQLVDTVLLSRDLDLENVPECLDLLPSIVRDQLKLCMTSGVKSDADWEKVRPIFGGNDEAQIEARELMKRNAGIFREYFRFRAQEPPTGWPLSRLRRISLRLTARPTRWRRTWKISHAQAHEVLRMSALPERNAHEVWWRCGAQSRPQGSPICKTEPEARQGTRPQSLCRIY